MTPVSDPACSFAVDVLAEVALGVADAEARAGALAHLEGCASCRAELRSLADTADALGSLTPEVDPPPGFEDRVVGSLLAGRRGAPRSCAPAGPGPARAGKGSRPRRSALALAAAAAVALGVGVAGWALSGAAGTPAPKVAVLTGRLVSGQRSLGEVVVVAGRSPWASVGIHGESGVAWVRCELVERGGEVVDVGTFRLAGGSGHWAASVAGGSAQVREALLVDTYTGRVVAHAELTPTS